MPIANVRGANINYEIIGSAGPWLSLSPGGRRDFSSVKTLAVKMADAGYRVLLHDRRNCGASDVLLDGDEFEFDVWAEDLYALLKQLDALPAFLAGGSSGCRISTLIALRHPEAVRALILWRVTGGRFAANYLADHYYGQYSKMAREGGMPAVCEAEHFRERIKARPANRDAIMALDPQKFSTVMQRWSEYLTRGQDMPVIGISADQLRSISVPTLIIPGNDRIHSGPIGRNVHQLIPKSELYELMPEDLDVDLVPAEDWAVKEDEMAQVFIDFLKRVRQRQDNPA